MSRRETLEFWLDYAARQRDLARRWEEMARGLDETERATRFRRLAYAALCAAHEAEDVVRMRAAQAPYEPNQLRVYERLAARLAMDGRDAEAPAAAFGPRHWQGRDQR